jgi:hypothetical protein
MSGKEIAITALIAFVTLALIGSQTSLRQTVYSSPTWI